MKKLFLFPYSLVRWLIITVIFLSLFLVFLIESPSVALALVDNQLKEQGIKYSSIEGGLLSGIRLKDVNYQEKIKLKELNLKVDWEKLEERILYIKHVTVEDIEIEREYLTSLIESNSSDENSSESNSTLPFDKIVLNRADISLKNIIYDAYKVNSAKLEIRDLTTDMKEEHKGDIKLTLDSNVTQLKLDGSIKNDFVKLLAKIEPNREFLNPFVVESNITLTNNPILTIKANGNMEKVKYHLNIHRLGLKQNEYQVDSKKLILFGNYNIPKKDVEATLKTELKGSMAYLKLDGDAKLNLDDLNNTLNYKLDTTINPKQSFLSQVLADQNVTFFESPTIKLKSFGNMKKLKYNLVLQQINLKQNEYSLQSDTVLLYGDYSVFDKSVVADIKTTIDSNVALVKLDGDTELDLDDLNNTLKFNLLANITPKKEFVESQIPDDNLSIESVADIDVVANGTLKDTKFKVDFRGLKGKREDIDFELQSLLLEGETDPLAGDTSVDISTNFDSTVGKGHIEDRVTLNFNRVESSLKHIGKIAIDANAKYLNRFLKAEKIVLKSSPKVRVELQGSTEKITIKLDGDADFTKENKPSKVTLQSRPIMLDLKNSMVDGSLKIKNSSNEIGFNLDSRFSGDYSKPEKLNIDTSVDIKSFNSFGVNLNPITPLKLKIKNSSSGALINLDSKRIRFLAKSPDHDRFSFDIKTRNLYLYKMIELPKELDHKFVKLNLKGSATLSKEHFKIKGTIDSNKRFQAKVDIKNDDSGIDGDIKTEYLLAKVKGNIKEKNLNAGVEISSLKKLQIELNKLYAFKKFDIDGSLKVDAKLKGEEIWAKVDSPKLALNGFDIEALGLDAHYNQELLTINKLNLQTTGFEDKKLNRKIYLNQPGKIYLGEKRTVLLDIYPNILVKADGTEENLDAKVKIDKLPLGHPDYGSMFLNCDIDYKQRGLDKSITGLIDIRKMKLFYEAKFLEADYDPDVVIVTKDDKEKKKGEEDSFLKHTAIDIKITAPQANYKTPDIDLIFDINLNAKKLLGEPLGILGKIEDINGRVDQVPKRFQVKNSNIVFTGDEKINPLLDINVEYELPQVLIQIGVGGNANRPKIGFSSEPPMPKKDIMSYLLLGVSATQIGEGEGSLGREAELFILNQAARDLAYEFELDRVFVKDDGTGEGFAIETGKKVSKKNMFIIESSKQGNSFILEHDVSKNIKLRVGQHQKEIPSQSADIYFRKRFR
ncbi:hypothetical protein GSY74_01685 [Sulfurovum sp. bin170]|uniref:translocation/assembly module TamB domain-containing protein n=1 Tax=Sulfurovum sp. bin170 TaxID=2695268 RepID=UPI0013DFCF47|nr:translocation/assembly module TamB domain-containing protein [Sulfurovum sp. bin170]NEW59982.1 hypothetical protein [Sulfurovum sp. bin170]